MAEPPTTTTPTNNNNDYISVPDTPLPSPSLSTEPHSGNEENEDDSSSFVSSRALRGFNKTSAGGHTANTTNGGAGGAGNSMIVTASLINSNQNNDENESTNRVNSGETSKKSKKKKKQAEAEAQSVRKLLDGSFNGDYEEIATQDPFEARNRQMIRIRLESDVVVCVFMFIFVFAVHVSTVFTVLNPVLNDIVFAVAILIGILNHYVLPRLRLETPWHVLNQPVLKPKHWSVFEPNYLARLEPFEVSYNFIKYYLLQTKIKPVLMSRE